MSAAVGDGLVLFSADRGKYYSFDEITTAIWAELSRPSTVSDLCSRLEAQFDVAPARCESDVLELLHSLREKGLIVVLSPGQT